MPHPRFSMNDMLEPSFQITAHWQQHNQALKWGRERCQRAHQTELPLGETFTVCPVQHGAATSFGFIESDGYQCQYHWPELVANLTAGDIEWLFRGEQGPHGAPHPRGPSARADAMLVECSVRVRKNSYDVATAYGDERDRGQQQQELPQACFDSSLGWDDGTRVRPHPDWRTTYVRCYAEDPHKEQVQPAKRGVGKSAGPGYFRETLNKDVSRILRFDTAKTHMFKRLG